MAIGPKELIDLQSYSGNLSLKEKYDLVRLEQEIDRYLLDTGAADPEAQHFQYPFPCDISGEVQGEIAKRYSSAGWYALIGKNMDTGERHLTLTKQ